MPSPAPVSFLNLSVARLYVALFGRAPDSAGLAFWEERLVTTSLAQVADQMFATTPARAYFPSHYGAAEIIQSFYFNVLGRVGDAEGLAFWTAKMEAPGATPGGVIAEMIQVISGYTGSDPAGVASAALFNNRAAAAKVYGELNGSLARAAAVLSSITTDPATVVQALTLNTGTLANGDLVDVSGYGDIVLGRIHGSATLAGAASGMTLRFTDETYFWAYVQQGTAVVELGVDTAWDEIVLRFDGTFADDHDGQSGARLFQAVVNAPGVEAIHVISTGTQIGPVATIEPDHIYNTLALNAPDLQALVFSGDHSMHYEADASMVSLSSVDARMVTGQYGFGFWASEMQDEVGMTIMGALTRTNALAGTWQSDVIVGGALNDLFAGERFSDLFVAGAGDILTGNGGNDTFGYYYTVESSLADPDVITDFQPNTVARGGDGALWDPAKAEFDPALRNGDVIMLPPASDFITVGVRGSETLVLSFLMSAAAANPGETIVGLDSSTGRLYIDVTFDGVADMAIDLPGVTTISAAAFS